MRIGKALVTALLLVAVGACSPLGTEEPALQMEEQALVVQPKEVGPFTAYFGHSSAVLDAKAQSVISSAIATAKVVDFSEIIVAGHADRSGSAKFNMELSERRVQAVAKAFEDAGFPPEKIKIAIHGEDQPLIPTSDGQGEAQNRRTEITLVRQIEELPEHKMQALEAQRKAEEERRLAAAEAKWNAEEERRLADAEATRKAEEERRLAAAEAKWNAEEERRLAEVEVKRNAEIEERLAGVEEKTEEEPCSQVELFVSNSAVSVCVSPVGQQQQ